MRTILHISKYYYPDLGGIETVAMYLAEGMTAYRNVVICFATDGMYSEEDIHGVKVYRVPVNFSFMSQDVAFSYRKILRQVLRQECPDAPMPCMCIAPIPLSIRLSARASAKRRRSCCIGTPTSWPKG